MSEWRDRRNERALARLRAALPERFPEVVWRHALARPLVPVTLTKAVESYWRAHPLRADRLSRALAAKAGAPNGWRWRIGGDASGAQASFRLPPAPYREREFHRGPGSCCVCSEPVYRFGWHRDLWGAGPNQRAQWHLGCVQAWKFWNAPSDQMRLLKRAQSHRCRETGRRLMRDAEVDHATPLYRVWRDHRDAPWPELLAFWGRPNLQVINRPAHLAKCSVEAADRAMAGAAQKAGAHPG